VAERRHPPHQNHNGKANPHLWLTYLNIIIINDYYYLAHIDFCWICWWQIGNFVLFCCILIIIINNLVVWRKKLSSYAIYSFQWLKMINSELWRVKNCCQRNKQFIHNSWSVQLFSVFELFEWENKLSCIALNFYQIDILLTL
jgi:hypothetical protein